MLLIIPQTECLHFSEILHWHSARGRIDQLHQKEMFQPPKNESNLPRTFFSTNKNNGY